MTQYQYNIQLSWLSSSQQNTCCFGRRMLHVSILPNRKVNQTISELSNQHNILTWLQQSRLLVLQLWIQPSFCIKYLFLGIATCNRIICQDSTAEYQIIALMMIYHFFLCQSYNKAHYLNQHCFSCKPVHQLLWL